MDFRAVVFAQRESGEVNLPEEKGDCWVFPQPHGAGNAFIYGVGNVHS